MNPYRSMPDPSCSMCKRRMDPASNSRMGITGVVCMNCHKATLLMDSIRGQVRELLALLTDDQRIAVLGEWFAGYCRHCGVELHGSMCHCTNDE